MLSTPVSHVINEDHGKDMEKFGIDHMHRARESQIHLCAHSGRRRRSRGHDQLQNMDRENAFSESDVRLLQRWPAA